MDTAQYPEELVPGDLAIVRTASPVFAEPLEGPDQKNSRPACGIEEAAFVAGGSNYWAPGQRVEDLLAGRPSTHFGVVQPSYKPGVKPTDLAQVLPPFVIEALREALPVFGRQVPGYDHPDAVLTGVETRTSSPIRIRRGADFQSINTQGLYPAGEGAGYAGGILSAAVDGIKVAEALATRLVAKA